MGEWAIVSSSPERLVRLTRDGLLETRRLPAPTREAKIRGRRRVARAGLQEHPQERAEHVMLVEDWSAMTSDEFSPAAWRWRR